MRNLIYISNYLLLMGFGFQLPAQTAVFGDPQHALKILKDLPTADQLEVDAEGNIFLLSKDEGVLYKYLATHRYDSAIFVGGISTREDGFLRPVKIALKNRQDFYVLDDLGRKIVLLDKELKRVQSSDFFAVSGNSTLGIPDEFEPVTFDISTAGEIFVLNQNNNRLYKINAFGDIELQFGGLDYGEGSLYEPQDIQVSTDNQVFVHELDPQHIKVFDMFGIYLQTIETEEEFKWENFYVYGSLLFLWNAEQLHIQNLLSLETRKYQLPTSLHIKDMYISREIIYLLLENEVHLHPITE